MQRSEICGAVPDPSGGGLRECFPPRNWCVHRRLVVDPARVREHRVGAFGSVVLGDLVRDRIPHEIVTGEAYCILTAELDGTCCQLRGVEDTVEEWPRACLEAGCVHGFFCRERHCSSGLTRSEHQLHRVPAVAVDVCQDDVAVAEDCGCGRLADAGDHSRGRTAIGCHVRRCEDRAVVGEGDSGVAERDRKRRRA